MVLGDEASPDNLIADAHGNENEDPINTVHVKCEVEQSMTLE